jgi:cytochrome P450
MAAGGPVRPAREPLLLLPPIRRDLGPWSPWTRFKRARAALDEFLYEEIAQRRREADLAERDVLSLLLQATDEDGRPMSDQELRDELVTVIGAGHETTATALAWTFERLLRSPLVLERLEQSLREGDTYLDACVKETLRMRPVILDLGRKTTREIELGGYCIPAGRLLLPSSRRSTSVRICIPIPTSSGPSVSFISRRIPTAGSRSAAGYAAASAPRLRSSRCV